MSGRRRPSVPSGRLNVSNAPAPVPLTEPAAKTHRHPGPRFGPGPRARRKIFPSRAETSRTGKVQDPANSSSCKTCGPGSPVARIVPLVGFDARTLKESYHDPTGPLRDRSAGDHFLRHLQPRGQGDGSCLQFLRPARRPGGNPRGHPDRLPAGQAFLDGPAHHEILHGPRGDDLDDRGHRPPGAYLPQAGHPPPGAGSRRPPAGPPEDGRRAHRLSHLAGQDRTDPAQGSPVHAQPVRNLLQDALQHGPPGPRPGAGRNHHQPDPHLRAHQRPPEPDRLHGRRAPEHVLRRRAGQRLFRAPVQQAPGVHGPQRAADGHRPGGDPRPLRPGAPAGDPLQARDALGDAGRPRRATRRAGLALVPTPEQAR